MAGYTSRILLTFTIPFFGFVLWFLKKKKSSRSVLSKGTQVEDSTPSALFERQIFEFDSTLFRNQESSCEDKSTMQLKETQALESQSTSVSHQNGTPPDNAQQNGILQDCALQHSDTQNDAPLVNGQHNGVSDNAISHISQDAIQTAVLENDVQEKGVSSNGIQQNSVQEKSVSSNGIQQNSVQEKSVSSNGIQQNSVQEKSVFSNAVQQNDMQEKSALSNGVQQNGISQKSVQQNGTQQNGASKGKKKKSKGREKPNTFSTDIRSPNEKLHLEIKLGKRVEAIDSKKKSAKDEHLNALKNGMDNLNGTNCDSQSNACSNGDIKPEIDHTVYNGPSAKECSKDVHTNGERNSNKTQQLQTEINTDPCTSLILPVDFANVVQINGDIIGSPGATYCDSLEILNLNDRLIQEEKYKMNFEKSVKIQNKGRGGKAIYQASIDSGRGASDFRLSPTQESAAVLSYAFEIPQKLVGLLIGRQGKNVNLIKQKTNADILIKRHPTNNQNKICLITGTDDEINAALRKIREKFPPERFPNVTLSQICFLPFMPCPENLMLRLPEGSSFDVMLSATVTAGHFFLQQPTHPTFHSLVALTYQMTEMYNRDLTAPPLPHMEKGFICAANLSNCWYRAEIDEVFYETDECRVKFLDYGGYIILPRAALRQINYQFMHVPFQATECYLGLLTLPQDKTEWSPQATAYFEELAQGQILQGFITAYAENGVPYVQLYKITGVEHIDINMALVQKGHARYIKPQPVA